MPVSSIQYAQVPWHYTNGFGIANDTTTPNTKFQAALGSTLDSTGAFQIILDDNVIVSATTNGINGLDTGSLVASKVYGVYVVGDAVNANETGVMLSLSYSGPLLPTGYNVFALIGFITTDASAHFLPGLWVGGDDATRLFMYDAPQATSVTAGNATSYTDVDITAFTPNWQNSNVINTTLLFRCPVIINSAFTPGAASRTFKMQPTGATGDAITVTGQVASVPITTQSLLFYKNIDSLSKISYKVSNSGDAVAINVAGYYYYI